jgi:hypothetical protein
MTNRIKSQGDNTQNSILPRMNYRPSRCVASGRHEGSSIHYKTSLATNPVGTAAFVSCIWCKSTWMVARILSRKGRRKGGRLPLCGCHDKNKQTPNNDSGRIQSKGMGQHGVEHVLQSLPLSFIRLMVPFRNYAQGGRWRTRLWTRRPQFWDIVWTRCVSD